MTVYHVWVLMSDGYYSVDDAFDVALGPGEHLQMIDFLRTAVLLGQIQDFKVELPRPGVSLANAKDRVTKWIAAYPGRHFGGPGGR